MNDVVRGGDRASLDLRQSLPPDELKFVEGLAAARPLDELAAELGWDMQKARRLSQSSRMLTALATVAITRLHAHSAPKAIQLLDLLMEGRAPITKIDDSGNTKVLYVDAKPEVALNAAKFILQMAGYDKPPPKKYDPEHDDSDLVEKTPEQLASQIDRLEKLLEKHNATDDAPIDVEDAVVIDELPNDFSVL